MAGTTGSTGTAGKLVISPNNDNDGKDCTAIDAIATPNDDHSASVQDQMVASPPPERHAAGCHACVQDLVAASVLSYKAMGLIRLSSGRRRRHHGRTTSVPGVTMIRSIAFVAAVAATSLLVGCGDKPNTPSTPSTPPPAASAPPVAAVPLPPLPAATVAPSETAKDTAANTPMEKLKYQT